jgi:hypothetical protein
MSELKIERLRLNLENATGHEHRLEPIALRAVTLLAERLDRAPITRANALDGKMVDSLNAEALDLNLNFMTDEQAAEGIASAWANALTAPADGTN